MCPIVAIQARGTPSLNRSRPLFPDAQISLKRLGASLLYGKDTGDDAVRGRRAHLRSRIAARDATAFAGLYKQTSPNFSRRENSWPCIIVPPSDHQLPSIQK